MATGKTFIDEGTGTAILSETAVTVPLVVGSTTGNAGVVELIAYDGSAWHTVGADTNGNLLTVGNVAAGATDSGSPVKVGGKNNTTLPTLTDGQRGDMQLGTRGAVLTQLMASNSTTAINNLRDNVDAVANAGTSNFLATLTRNTVYNGTTWDRQPGTTKGAYSLIQDAAGNARGANVNASNQLSVSVDNAPVLGAGTALIGKVDTSGTTDTTTTGNITVVDATCVDTTTNSQLAQHIITGTPDAGSFVTVATGGRSSVVIQIAKSGTQWTGTIQFERSADGGITYTTATALMSSASNVLNSATGNVVCIIPTGGFTHVRLRATAAIANTAAVTLTASNGIDIAQNANAARIFDNTTSSSLSITSGYASVRSTTEDTASADGDPLVAIAAVRKATPVNTSGTDGDYEALQVSNGKLWVQGTVAEDVASADGDIGVPAMAVRKATPANTSGTDGDYENLQISNGKLWTQGTYAEDAPHTNADIGVFVMGVRDDTLNATSGTEGDYEALHTTATGALWVTQTTSSTGGWTAFNATSSDGATALTNTAQAIKASAGTLGGWYIYNPNSTAQFVQLYNTAQGSVTVGTTNPLFMLTIPATSAANVEFGNGINFPTAISCSATSTAGGNGAPTTALDAVFYYS